MFYMCYLFHIWHICNNWFFRWSISVSNFAEDNEVSQSKTKKTFEIPVRYPLKESPAKGNSTQFNVRTRIELSNGISDGSTPEKKKKKAGLKSESTTERSGSVRTVSSPQVSVSINTFVKPARRSARGNTGDTLGNL